MVSNSLKNEISLSSETLVFIPTYNEADNITDLVAAIWSFLPGADILVIDDSSPDKTGEIVLSLKEKYGENSIPSLNLISRPKKLGLGSAHKDAMLYALKKDYQKLITMDADFSHHPRYLKTISDSLDTHEFVIGSRYAEGGKCDYSFSRLFLSKSANFLIRALLGIPLKETTTSYRGFKKSLLENIAFSSISSKGYSFPIEVVNLSHIASQKSGESFMKEVPIHFSKRRYGKTKISNLEVLKAMVTLTRLSGDRIRRKLS